MDLPRTGWAVLIPILTFTPLNLRTGKKDTIRLIMLIIRHRLPITITSDSDLKRKLESVNE